MLRKWFLNKGRFTIRNDDLCFKVVILYFIVNKYVPSQISDLGDIIIELLYRMIFWKFDAYLDGVLLINRVNGHASLLTCLHGYNDADRYYRKREK